MTPTNTPSPPLFDYLSILFYLIVPINFNRPLCNDIFSSFNSFFRFHLYHYVSVIVIYICGKIFTHFILLFLRRLIALMTILGISSLLLGQAWYILLFLRGRLIRNILLFFGMGGGGGKLLNDYWFDSFS